LTGTSGGAINASILASYPDTDICQIARFLEDVWINRIPSTPTRCGNGIVRFRGDLLRLIDLRCLTQNPIRTFNDFARDGAFFAQYFFQRGLHFLVSSGSIEDRVLDLIDVSAIVTAEPFEELLPQIVSLEGIRRSERKLRIVATNWVEGIVRTFANAEMTDQDGLLIIRGSAAIPGIFQPVYIQSDPYVDGGVLMNTPLNCAIDEGATELHIIYVDPNVENIPLQQLSSTLSIFDRLLVINWAAKTNEDIDNARSINHGLDVIELASQSNGLSGVSNEDLRTFVRVAARIKERIKAGMPYKKLTIHRYHPNDDLGGGTLGLLDFSRDRMVALVERGFSDAVNHDCKASHCVLPK
jgi:predicted acylesterase/phospholipase RssA